MVDFDAEAFVILLAQSGSQSAAAAGMGSSQAAVSRQLKSARKQLGDARVLELIQQHQRDEACGVTLRKPFISGTGTCGVCGGAKTAQPSGNLRCNSCRKARYRAAHPIAVVENPLSPEEAAVQFLVPLAEEGTHAAAALALGVSRSVVSTRLASARRVLGDERTIELLKAHQRDAKCGHTLLKPFFLNSLTCRLCGEPRTPLATTGELVCQPCSNRRNQQYKKRHAARVAAAAADYREKNRESLRQKHREYREANPDLNAAYYAANAERIKATVRGYRKVNKDKIAEYHRERAKTDPAFREAGRARHRAWKKRNPDKVNADTARRQLRLRQAYVAWANDELIAEAYELARMRTVLTGIPWQVDHIVPLSNDLVCGLHCEANLQVIPAVTNLAKSNDWWPDMPAAPAHLVAFAARPSLYLAVADTVPVRTR